MGWGKEPVFPVRKDPDQPFMATLRAARLGELN
jgi:hypothetical protein